MKKMCLTYMYFLLEISANERIKLISEGIAVVNFYVNGLVKKEDM